MPAEHTPHALPQPTRARRPTPTVRAGLVGREVTEYIRSLIVSGALKAGDRLRVEHIAAELEISVTPVREALVELLGEGFVERRPRRGYVVAELTRRGLEDGVLVLAMITGELAARAASHITPEGVAQLRELQSRLNALDARGERAAAEQINHRLHGDINLAAESPELAWMAQRSTRYVPSIAWDDASTQPRTCSYDHTAVLDALAAGDPKAAREAMFTHLVESGKRLAEDLDGVLWPAPAKS
jgi:DNA-binding GntR family transcriptional regulator